MAFSSASAPNVIGRCGVLSKSVAVGMEELGYSIGLRDPSEETGCAMRSGDCERELRGSTILSSGEPERDLLKSL